MAEGSAMVLSHALCFLFSKLHKFESKRIKASMLEFYSADDIHEAKETLVNIVSTLSDKLTTKVRDTRDGDGRICRELDDIFTVINDLDEKLILDKLPLFVSDSPEKMPSNQLIEGDVRAIMSKFSKMEFIVEQLQTTVNNSTAAIADIAATIHGQSPRSFSRTQ